MKVNPIPEGYHTVTPYLPVQGVPKLIEFLEEAFGAEVKVRHETPDGTVMNAEVKVGDSIIMMGEAHGDHKPRPAMLYMYVSDADATYKRAIKAGGKAVLEPMDHFYGDRSGAVDDPAGNQWWIASRKENLSPEEFRKRASQQKG